MASSGKLVFPDRIRTTSLIRGHNACSYDYQYGKKNMKIISFIECLVDYTVVLCFVVVMQSFIMNSHEVFIHIHQGCFAGTGAIVRLPQCQGSKPDGYGKISQCITTTKHSKAKTLCIFLGIYCICDAVVSLKIRCKHGDNVHFAALYFEWIYLYPNKMNMSGLYVWLLDWIAI